jgi:hypothetical protein
MLITRSEKFQKFEFEVLAGIVSNTWQAKSNEIEVYCELHCRRSSRPCSHARGHLRGRAQLPLPRPKPCDMGGNGGHRPDPPLFSFFLSASSRPPRPRQHRPTALRSRDNTPPAREQGRRARCRPCTSPAQPAPATHWAPLSPPLWPIKAPADQTNERAPLPATSQTTSPLPARSSSTSSALPARYWTRKVPPRSASVEQADAGNWWRSLAGVFSARRYQALLPLRSPPSPSSSSLRAGELRPRRRTRHTSAVGFESVGSVPVRCG